MDHSEEFFVVDSIVLFGGGECFGVISNGTMFASVILLGQYSAGGIVGGVYIEVIGT
jgi:hypothetical protein